MSSQKRKFQNKLVDVKDESFLFEYTQIEGEYDWGLLETTFDEFVKYPILMSLERGRPIIKTAKTSILNNLLKTKIEKKESEKKIVFTLTGVILKNKLVSIDEIPEGMESIKINDDNVYLLIDNVAANRVGMALAVWYVIDWLNGLSVEVNRDDYIVSCKNCMLNTENLYKYYKLYDVRARTFIEQNEGCIVKMKEFKKGEGCNKFFIRNTYPDLGEISDIIKDYT